MAETRMIKTRIWSDGWFADLSERAQRLYLYIITNKNTRICGFYELPMFEVCAHMKWTEPVTLGVFAEIEPKVVYRGGWVYIQNYPEHQNVANNTSVQAAIERELKNVPEKVLNLKSEIINPKSEGVDTLSTGWQDPKKAGKSRKSGVAQAGDKAVHNTKVTSTLYDDPLFEKFWDAYPKKQGKGEAWKSWKKLSPSKLLGEQIVSVTMLYAKTPQWVKEDGQYVPNPATFLNQRRFDDSPKVAGSNSKYHGV